MYILIWLGTVWLNGGYDQRYDLRRLVRGLAFGTLFLAAVYGFLDLDYRPSRALVLLGAVWATLATIALRAGTHFLEYRNFRIGRDRVKNLVVVGSAIESERVMGLLKQAGVPNNFIGTVAPPGQHDDRTYLSSLERAGRSGAGVPGERGHFLLERHPRPGYSGLDDAARPIGGL